eukprot:6286799-Lingulodinium_polyedra.AAC.1
MQKQDSSILKKLFFMGTGETADYLVVHVWVHEWLDHVAAKHEKNGKRLVGTVVDDEGNVDFHKWGCYKFIYTDGSIIIKNKVQH